MFSLNIDNLDKTFDKSGFISEQMEDKNIDIEFIWCSCFSNAQTIRIFVELIFTLLWFDKRDVSKFILVIDELFNNAVEYWTKEGDDNKIRIKSINTKDNLEIIIEVEDRWNWKKHKTALEMETLRAHRLKRWYGNHDSIRWRGLFMIAVKTVDRVYFKDTSEGGLIVWLRKKIKKETNN